MQAVHFFTAKEVGRPDEPETVTTPALISRSKLVRGEKQVSGFEYSVR